MRKVNLEVIRKELYSNLQEMFFGAFYHMREFSKVCYDEQNPKTVRIKTLYDTLEIKRSKPFSNYERTIYITVEETGVYCFFANTDDKCYDYQWDVSYSDCKNKSILYMKVAQKLTMLLLN